MKYSQVISFLWQCVFVTAHQPRTESWTQPSRVKEEQCQQSCEFSDLEIRPQISQNTTLGTAKT